MGSSREQVRGNLSGVARRTDHGGKSALRCDQHNMRIHQHKMNVRPEAKLMQFARRIKWFLLCALRAISTKKPTCGYTKMTASPYTHTHKYILSSLLAQLMVVALRAS